MLSPTDDELLTPKGRQIERLGTGTGTINYVRAMGSVLGTAVLGALVARSAQTSHVALAVRLILVVSLGHVFLITLGVGVAVLIITMFLKDVRLRKRGEGMPMKNTKMETLISPVNDEMGRRSQK